MRTPKKAITHATHAKAAMIDASGHPIDLEVDGGVKSGIAEQVIEAGADVIVAGSAVFRAEDYGAAIAALRSAADKDRA